MNLVVCCMWRCSIVFYCIHTVYIRLECSEKSSPPKKKKIPALTVNFFRLLNILEFRYCVEFCWIFCYNIWSVVSQSTCTYNVASGFIRQYCMQYTEPLKSQLFFFFFHFFFELLQYQYMACSMNSVAPQSYNFLVLRHGILISDRLHCPSVLL